MMKELFVAVHVSVALVLHGGEGGDIRLVDTKTLRQNVVTKNIVQNRAIPAHGRRFVSHHACVCVCFTVSFVYQQYKLIQYTV